MWARIKTQSCSKRSKQAKIHKSLHGVYEVVRVYHSAEAKSSREGLKDGVAIIDAQSPANNNVTDKKALNEANLISRFSAFLDTWLGGVAIEMEQQSDARVSDEEWVQAPLIDAVDWPVEKYSRFQGQFCITKPNLGIEFWIL